MRSRQKESGIVLVITLWIIVVLSTVALAYVQQVNMEIKMVGFQRDVAVVEETAKAGLRQAMILLREDKIKDSGEDVQMTITNFGDDDNFRYDGGTEAWAEGRADRSNENLYVDVPFYESGDRVGYYYVSVEDEAAKFPINNMQTSLDQIAHLLESTGVDEDDAKLLAAAIIDWRDPDSVVTDSGKQRMGGDGGDEYSYYNSGSSRQPRGRGRERMDDGFPDVMIKNGPLDGVDELLLIPGMTPAIVYGTVDPDDNPSRGRMGRRRLRKGEYLGLENFITVYTNQANLNSVKTEVLEALLFPYAGENAEKIAQNWTEYRDGRDRETYTDDDEVLKTLDNSDMDDVHYTKADGFTEELFKQAQPFLTNMSDTFDITCLAEYQGIEKGYHAIVGRQYTSWENLPIFGVDTMKLEDLEQSRVYVRVFEPIFDAKEQIAKINS